jgi:hypothetical protein
MSLAFSEIFRASFIASGIFSSRIASRSMPSWFNFFRASSNNVMGVSRSFSCSTIRNEEETPRFDETMRKLEDQLKTEKVWAYNVIDECLHVGMYKGPMKLLGPGILKGLAKQAEFTYVLANYKTVIRSLNRPIFSLPFSPELIYDILFDRVDLIFMINLDGYISLFKHFGLSAKWVSRKETAKILEQNKEAQIFVHQNRCICIEDEKKTKTMYLSLGILQRMFFEFILPSYTAYMTLYYFGIDTSDAGDGSVGPGEKKEL